MITRRLLTLQAVLLFGLGSVFLLPSHTGLGPAGIAMSLPRSFAGWTGSDAPIAAEELKGLAPDTGFVRQLYTNPEFTHSKFGQVYVSIVLSGEDMVNSIHRPERCLSAQGWTVEHSAVVHIPRADGGPPVAVTRLTDVRDFRPEGKTIALKNLNYYWFIGSRDSTPSHWTRTFIDARDRVLHGENQRWAYVTVSTYVTDNLEPGGRTEEQTAKMIEDFIGEIVPLFQKPGTAGPQEATPRAQSGSEQARNGGNPAGPASRTVPRPSLPAVRDESDTQPA